MMSIDVLQVKLQRFDIMIPAALARPNKLRHQETCDRRILELISAGTAGHVEAGQVGLVVDRDPVAGHVIERDDSLHRRRGGQAGIALSLAIDLSLPLVGKVLVPFVRIHVDALVAIRILAANQNVIAGFRSAVAADIAVRDDKGIALIVEARGRRHMRDLYFERAGLDIHAGIHARHRIDLHRMRAGNIDDDV